MPARGHETIPERRALPQREVRHREAQLRPRTARQGSANEDRRLRPAASREAEGAPHLRRAGTPVPQHLRKGRARQGHHRREPDVSTWSAASTASSTAWASAPAAPRPARSSATATSRSTAASAISRPLMVKVGDVVCGSRNQQEQSHHPGRPRRHGARAGAELDRRGPRRSEGSHHRACRNAANWCRSS